MGGRAARSQAQPVDADSLESASCGSQLGIQRRAALWRAPHDVAMPRPARSPRLVLRCLAGALSLVAAAPDLYDLLGVSAGATAEDLRRAYRRKSVAVHPDKCPASERVACEAARALSGGGRWPAIDPESTSNRSRIDPDRPPE